MRLLIFKICILTIITAQCDALGGGLIHNLQSMLESWKKPEKHNTIRLHLEDNEELIVPKNSKIKVLSSDASERFYAELAHNQPPKFLHPAPVPVVAAGKFIPGLVLDPQHKNFLRPISLALPIPPITNVVLLPQHHQLPENIIKPVEEKIEHDLKYDFRTKIHSV